MTDLDDIIALVNRMILAIETRNDAWLLQLVAEFRAKTEGE